jgi:hypothetical protein
MKSNYLYSHSLSYPDNGGTNSLRNVDKFLPDNTTKNPKRGFYPVTSVRTYVKSAQENDFSRFRRQLKCPFILCCLSFDSSITSSKAVPLVKTFPNKGTQITAAANS